MTAPGAPTHHPRNFDVDNLRARAHNQRMNTTPAPTKTPTSAGCAHRSDLGLGCARNHGHDGAHWLTSQPAAAHADLLRNGFWSRLVEAEAQAHADESAARAADKARSSAFFARLDAIGYVEGPLDYSESVR